MAVAADAKAVRAPLPVTWPAPTTTTIDLTTAAPAGTPLKANGGTTSVVTVGAAAARPGGQSRAAVPVTPPSAVAVTIHDRTAAQRVGVDGLLLSLTTFPAPNPVAQAAAVKQAVSVKVDYAGFAHAFGGDWASRLRLVAMPACALTTPTKAACQTSTDLASTNNPRVQTLSAPTVTLTGAAPTVLAAKAGPSGDNGDYTATSLSNAGTWQVTNQTGDFSWSYPLRTPPSLGGPAPALSLAYSSQSVDGLTGATNNQGGWVGDGWSMWPGFIERKYASCSDDNPDHKTGDECWFNQNATLSMNGHAGELVQDGAVWRLKNDDGTVVRRLTDPSRDNGDDDDEYWQVVTPDGVQYFFGYHKLPSWSSGDPVTNSVWTVPVYGNNDSDPCHKDSGFADSRCDQAWRWNLDYVLDPHGNSMAYFYKKETGAYGRDAKDDQRTTYDRGGWLDRVEYGMRKNHEYDSAAPLRVTFSTEARCDSGCWKGEPWTSDPVASAWPDTPWDQYCDAEPCTEQLAPTFFSARRLTTITAQVRTGADSYAAVESWKLRQEFLSAGTGEGIPLWLRGITRTGQVTRAGGTAQSDPEITFNPGSDPLANRVDGVNDQRTDLARWRIKQLVNESGGKTLVTYSEPDCTRKALPDPATNTQRCMPAFYSWPGTGDPTIDWFHKYVVTRIDQDDTATDQPDQTTFYDYLDKPAWHYIDDEITKDKYRTWGEWRGYGHIQVRTGAPTGQQTATDYRYLRGMDGDHLTKTTTRNVSVEGTWGGSIDDQEALQGFLRQEITLNGPDGAEVSSTVNDPWLKGPTATRKRNDITTNAWQSLLGTAQTRTALSAGGFRTTKTTKRYNSDALITQEDDFGDESTPTDDVCTRTTYARNTDLGLLDRVSQTEKLSGTCGNATDPAAPATVLSRTRHFYDTYKGDGSFGDPPVKGDIVRTENLERFTGSTPVYTATSKTYDDNGRVLSDTDARGYTTTTAYTTTNGGLVTGTLITNPLGHGVTTVREPAWDLATKITDANQVVTQMTYDGLGRITAVWLPGRSKGTDTASLLFDYQLRQTGGPTAVTTRTLLPTGAGYRTSISLYDGFLRQRQAQVQASGGGRNLTDTLYDAAGRIDWESQAYYDATNTAPNTTLGVPTGQIPAVTQHVYDGAGRETAVIFKALGAEKWRTTTVFGGDRTQTIPPLGGTATTAITDVDGNVTALRQHKSFDPVAATVSNDFDTTTYTYTLLGQRKSVVDQAKNTWTYAYDLRGRQILSKDPDKGTVTSTYDAAGNLATTTSPYGTGTATATLAYTYDKIGRRTSIHDTSDTGQLRAEWVYDKTPITSAGGATAKGKLTSSTRYVKPTPTATQPVAYTTRTDFYDAFIRPTTTSVVVPPSDSGLCAASAPNTCTYTTTTGYKANGQPSSTAAPAVGDDLPAEKLTYGYTDIGETGTLFSAAQVYIDAVSYDKIGQLTQRVLGDSSIKKHLAITSQYDEPTRRLTNTNVVPANKPEAVNYGYDYDNAGNVTKISDTPAGQQADTQCYTYDFLRRLTRAWTPATDSCAAAPPNSTLGGPAPYWHEWDFDTTGNRKTETRKTVTGDTTTYTYVSPPSGPTSIRPHTVTSVTATGAATGTKNYTYDSAGNTTTRPSPTNAAQTLTWDPEGNLASSTEGTATTSYIYDADGNRLVRADPNGNRTLFMADGTEVHYDKAANTKKGIRYYTHAGMTIAMRAANKLIWIIGDHHGTAEVTLDATTLTATKRRTLPYGEQRGTDTGSWLTAMDKGMVGGTKDPTGLTHLGAREYDPFLGRFISVDPKVQPDDPQTLHGYLYSNNNPATFSDPNGESWGTFWKVAAVVAVVAVVVVVAVVAGPALLAAGPAIAACLEAGATTAAITGSATATTAAVATAAASEAAVAGGAAMAWGGAAATLTAAGVAGRIYTGTDGGESAVGLRPGNKQPKGGNGRVLTDGYGATAEEMAASKANVVPGPKIDAKTRQEILDRDQNPDGSWDCWRCGWNFDDPNDGHVGHRNLPRSLGGNKEGVNLCMEGWACNTNARNTGQVTPGRSCAERYACGDVPASRQRSSTSTGNSGGGGNTGTGGSGGTTPPRQTDQWYKNHGMM